MHRVEAEALREQAAVVTRRRIAADREKASPRVAPILRYVERHLFEPELRYERIRRALDIRDNNRSTVFRQEMGLAPAEYVRDCRFDVACRLLSETTLDVGRIAEVVGYTTPQVFTAAFRRWSGLTPIAYRRQERRLRGRRAEPEGVAPPPQDVPDLSPAAWRRFVNGELEGGEADLLVRYLLDVYPHSRRNLLRAILRQVRLEPHDGAGTDDVQQDLTAVVPSLRSLFAREDIERLMAEVVWEDLRDLPWHEQRDLVRHHLRFTTPALFELLGEKSREAGRRDRQAAIGVARLALEAAAALDRDVREDGCSEFDARAWTWIGNSKRRALDFEGAEKAFLAAQRRLPPEHEAPAAASELWFYKSMLRRDQRRLDEALELQHRAIDLAHGQPLPTSVRTVRLQSLIARALTYRAAGSADKAETDLLAALELADLHAEPHLRYGIFFNLARTRLELGELRAARRDLQSAAKLQAALGRVPDEVIRMRWLGALISLGEEKCEEAEKELTAVHREYRRLGRPEAAVVALDLALLLLSRGELGRAYELAAESLPLFEALSDPVDAQAAKIVGDQARVAAERLRLSLEQRSLTGALLRDLQPLASRLLEAPAPRRD